MSDNPRANKIPESWAWTDLGSMVGFEYGKGLRKDKRDQNGKIPVFGSNGIVGYHSSALTTRPCVIVGRKGTAGAVHLAKEPSWPIDTTYFVYPPSGVDLDFLYYLLSTLGLDSLDRSTAIPGLNRDDAYAVNVPLPPLPEQHRIVDKIEELFTKLDAGIESLKKAQAQLKQYRQSVLKAAVEGKLTEEWRAAHKDELEPASVLLERIQKERREKWEAEQLESFAAKGKTPKDDKWKGKYKETRIQIPNEGTEPPTGWAWARLDSVSEALGGYAFRSKNYTEDGFQIVKIGNVKMGRLTLLQKPSFVKDIDESIREKYLLRRNDIVITLTGTRRKRDYGFVAMIRDEENLLLNQRVARLRFHPSLHVGYFVFALQSEHFRNSFFRNETGNVGQGNVGMKAITQEYILLPPLSEQQRIVADTERCLSVIDSIEETIESEVQRADRLRQSILKQAFSGKLVLQDPTDEPANILLERIKTEKRELEKEKGKSKAREAAKKANKSIIKPSTDLYEILIISNKPLHAEELLKISAYDIEKIEKFYTQLQKEMEKGRIIERRLDNMEVVLEARK